MICLHRISFPNIRFSAGSSTSVNASSDLTRQCAAAVLMIRPAAFGYNEQTAESNRFQQPLASQSTAQRARVEFERLESALIDAGVQVCALDDTAEPVKPDAVFPNNWVSFHRSGRIVLYPMQAANRRPERRTELLAAVEQRLPFKRRELLDLSGTEAEGRYLEGTGSLVLDHIYRRAYACRSIRTDESVAREWAARMNYEAVIFDAHGRDGSALYHTNVQMSIGAGWAAVCSEAIDARDRERVLSSLRQGRELIEFSLEALHGFAGNMLELIGANDAGRHSLLVMSQRARQALATSDADALERLQRCVAKLLCVDIDTIETVGGGSVRCMLAEVPESRA